MSEKLQRFTDLMKQIFELDKSIEHGAYINSLIEKLEQHEEPTDEADDNS